MSVLAAISIATAVVTAPVLMGANASRVPQPTTALAPAASTRVLTDDGSLESVAVLSFDGEGKGARNLAIALGRVLQSRGHEVRTDATFAELRLALRCADYETRCLARAPENLGVDAVVFGTVREADGDAKVELFLIAAGASDVSAHVSAVAASTTLGGAGAHGEAKRLAEQLWPMPVSEDSTYAPVASPPPAPRIPAPRLDDDRNARPSDYEMKVWAKAGIGVSAGLFGLGLVGAIASSVVINNSQSEIQTRVASSPNDRNPSNDISTSAPDYCEAAQTPPSNGEGGVTNSSVSEVCRTAASAQTLNHASFAVLGVGIAGAVGFVTAHFVIRSRHRRGLATRISPTNSGMRIRF